MSCAGGPRPAAITPCIRWLAGWLADHEQMDELRGLVAGHWELLSSWVGRQCNMRVVRLAAELGDAGAAR